MLPVFVGTGIGLEVIDADGKSEAFSTVCLSSTLADGNSGKLAFFCSGSSFTDVLVSILIIRIICAAGTRLRVN